MNDRRLKLLTRDLITACGGLVEATAACRYDAPRLSRCQTVGQPDFLAIDVVAVLEAYCGKPIISQALVDEAPEHAAPGNLLKEGCEALEDVARLATTIRLATEDGKLTPREGDDIVSQAHRGIEQLRDVIHTVRPTDAA